MDDRPLAPSWGRRLVLAVTALAATSCATPPPMTVETGFADHVPAALAKSPAALQPACRVTVSSLTDARRAPETLGMVGGRAMKSPPDSQAWLRSILMGLEARGLDVEFGPPEEAPSSALDAKVSLQSAWVTAVATNFTANVVLRVTASRPGQPALQRDYRGSLSRINWASSTSELQRIVDLAFADALNEMAGDLRPLCPSIS